jgi:hypothetical protein
MRGAEAGNAADDVAVSERARIVELKRASRSMPNGRALMIEALDGWSRALDERDEERRGYDRAAARIVELERENKVLREGTAYADYEQRIAALEVERDAALAALRIATEALDDLAHNRQRFNSLDPTRQRIVDDALARIAAAVAALVKEPK